MSNETPNTPQQEAKAPVSRKPVIMYIMILCIAAFLLMALSFAMHQRSNQEAIGNLETSFNSTIAQMQETQERILELEKELSETNNRLEQTETQLNETGEALDTARKEAEALEALYVVQQKYSAGLYQECLTLIARMEADGLTKALSPIPIVSETGGTVTAPYNRYLQFKEAAAQKLAYNAENGL